jgi:hypothetical protein
MSEKRSAAASMSVWQAFIADAKDGNVASLCDALRRHVKFDALPIAARALLADYIQDRVGQRGRGRPARDLGGCHTWESALNLADRGSVRPLCMLLRSDLEITGAARRALADYCEYPRRITRANGRPQRVSAERIYGAYRAFLTAHPRAVVGQIYERLARHFDVDVTTVRDAVARQQQQQLVTERATPWSASKLVPAHAEGDVPVDDRDDKQIRKRPIRRKPQSRP